MSKRMVLAGLLLLVSGPMLLAETAPVGALVALAAVALLVLPHLGERRAAY